MVATLGQWDRGMQTEPQAGDVGSIESWLVSGGRERRPGAPLNVPPWPGSNFVPGGQRDEAESDPTTAQIRAHWQRFYESALADRIPNRTDGAVLYGVYSGYESDHRGAYPHLIACEVSNGGNVPPAITSR
jgi:hypothetical protein